MIQPRKIKAVSFDAAGTLIHLAEDVGTSYARVAARFGIRADPSKLGEAFKSVWERTPPPFSQSSAANDPTEKHWWHRLVHAVFNESGATLPGRLEFEEFFETLYLHFEEPGTWVAEEDAKRVLDSVCSGFRCVVLSNFDSRLRRILSDLGLLDHFERVFLSCELRASKPNPRIFQEVSNALEIRPAEIMHVGDDPICDWEGASAAGFQHFRVGKGQRRLLDLLDELSLA